jgi:hypothetical protein
LHRSDLAAFKQSFTADFGLFPGILTQVHCRGCLL